MFISITVTLIGAVAVPVSCTRPVEAPTCSGLGTRGYMRLKLHIDKIPPPQPTSRREGQLWVTGGKTLKKHMSSGLLRIADMVESTDSHRTG